MHDSGFDWRRYPKNALAFLKQKPRYAFAVVCALVFTVFVFAQPGRQAPTPVLDFHRAPPVTASTEKAAGFSHSPYNDTLDLSPQDLERAVQRSETLWQRNVEKRNDFVASKGGYNAIKMFTFSGSRRFQPYTLWDIFVPAFPCPYEVERVGRMGDGGKYTCGLPKVAQAKKCIVYSFGIGVESRWEAEILERTSCDVYGYDFSVTKFGPQIEAMNKSTSSRAHFFQLGLGSENKSLRPEPIPMKQVLRPDAAPEALIEYATLRTLMERNGHDWIDILKVDIEGAEFSVLPQIVEDFGNGKLPFSQLLLEIHADYSSNQALKLEDFAAWWELLESAGLRAFSSELNYPSTAWLDYPTAMEMSFLNNCNGKAECGRLLRS